MSDAAPSGARVLIVEDSEVQAIALLDALRSEGFDVVHAASAEAALELLNANTPDIVVADLHLPTMDGHELTRQIRLNARTRFVPVLIMTSAGGPQGERAGLESGADAYVEKSRDLAPLVYRLRVLLRSRSGREELAGAQFRRARLALLYSSPTQGLKLKHELGEQGFAVDYFREPDLLAGALDSSPAAFDCVVVNLLDARFEGVEACAKLVAHRDAGAGASPTAPFLLVGVASETGLTAELLRQAYEAGADDVVGVGPDASLLSLRLRALVRRRLMQEEAQRLAADRAAAQVEGEQFRALVQGVRDYAICLLDPAGRVSTWNAGAERIKGYKDHEIVGRHFSTFYTEEERAAGLPERALAEARLRGRFEVEAIRVRKNGEKFWAHVILHPVIGPAGELVGFAKVTRDVTDVKRAADELREARSALLQAQKMEAIGQLTGGIAHDFNNMLASIIGGLNLLKRRIDDGRLDQVDMLLDAARTSADRAAALTSRLLAFGRQQSLDIRPVDVNAVIGSMPILLDRTMGESVSVTLKLGEGALWANTDENQLESALLNLAINARDAMPEGGALTIEADVETVKADSVEDVAAGRYVRIGVRDEGVGMSEEVLKKVFEPFFTTKPIGQGTGLGLSMVYGFVRQSGGHVRIASAVGAGTTVRLYLPSSDQPAAEEARPADASERRGRGERVLVVEDDAQVRLFVLEALRDLGYEGIEAASVEDARAVVESDAKIDLVVSDVGLPGMDGRRLADELKEKRPDLRFLFITGYAKHARVRSEFLEDGMSLILKPFSLDELATAIADALGS